MEISTDGRGRESKGRRQAHKNVERRILVISTNIFSPPTAFPVFFNHLSSEPTERQLQRRPRTYAFTTQRKIIKLIKNKFHFSSKSHERVMSFLFHFVDCCSADGDRGVAGDELGLSTSLFPIQKHEAV